MSEQTFWFEIRQKMGHRWHAVRIENAVAEGTPDVNYAMGNSDMSDEGWIELKNIKEWPKRPDTIVRIDHFTQEQRAFLTMRRRAGGNAFLFLRVEKPRTYLLFDGEVAAKYIGTLNRTALERAAGLRALYSFPLQALTLALAPRIGRVGAPL